MAYDKDHGPSRSDLRRLEAQTAAEGYNSLRFHLTQAAALHEDKARHLRSLLDLLEEDRTRVRAIRGSAETILEWVKKQV